MTADIVHHLRDGVHRAGRIVAEAVCTQKNLDHIRVLSGIQLIVIPVEHFLNRIIKRLNPLAYAVRKKLRRLQIILRRKTASSLVAVTGPAPCSCKGNLIAGQMVDGAVPLFSVGQTVPHIHNGILAFQLLHHMERAGKCYRLIDIVIVDRKRQRVISHLFFLSRDRKTVFQILAYLAVPVAGITIPEARPDHLIVVQLYGAAYRHIDVLRQIGLHLRLIFVQLSLQIDIPPEQSREEKNHHSQKKLSVFFYHFFSSPACSTFVSLQIKMGRCLVSM